MSFNDPEILQDFLIESGELLEELDADLVTLEDSSGDAELLNKVFRALHTIKGSASFLGMANLVAIAHVAEDALNGARKGEVTIDKRFIDAILEAVDILKGQFVELQSGQDLTAPPDELVQRLALIAKSSCASAANPEESAPAPEIEEPAPAPEVAAVASAADFAEESEWPRRSVMALTAGKSELIDFMVTDLEESITLLQENLPKLGDPTSQQDAALELAELTEGVSRTVEFFEFSQLGTLVDTINLVAERACDFSEDAMAQTMPRLLAIAHLMGEQTSGLKIGEIVQFDVDELCARVADVVLGHDLEEGIRVGPDTSIEDVFRMDHVQGAIELDEANAPAQPVIETPDAASVSVEADPAQTAAPEQDQAPAPEAPTPPAAAPPPSKVEQTIRVEVSRLEALLNLVGELVIQKNRVGALSRSIVSTEAISQDMREAVAQGSSDLDRITGDIQVAVMRTRMQPLDKIFGKYPRLIRDLARKTGKEMQLVVDGGDVEVDKSVIEELGDPLVHLMRNSADHGIESPEDRKESGKDVKGTIRLVAVHEGSHVVIQMIDDGAGLSREKLTKKAIERGLTTEDDAEQLSDREVYRFIMAAGFSMAAKVSDISGRGVGMDVVRNNIESLKGTIDVDSIPGQGTTITIKIPLTVAIMPAMMVGVGSEQYAIPLSSILEIVMPEDQEVSTVHGRRVMRLRDAVLPLVSVSDLFEVPETARSDGKFAVIVELNEQTAGLMVEELIGQQEVVVKPLDEDIAGDGLLSGATVRDDGGVSLIVDIGRMIAAAAEHEGALAA